MPKRTKTTSVPFSLEECETSLPTYCIHAMSSNKMSSQETYCKEIDSLAKICDCLVTHHHKTLSSVIETMEQSMTEAHNQEIAEIDKKIKHLFQLRKQTPCNSSYCEMEVMKLTTEIRLLEERKAISVNDAIEAVIYDALKKAVKTWGMELGSFNLEQYEYQHKGTGFSESPFPS